MTSRLRPSLRILMSVLAMNTNSTLELYCLRVKPTASASGRIPLHIQDRESSGDRTGRSAHATTRKLLLGFWVMITLRRGSRLSHRIHRRRPRRRRDRLTTRTRMLGSRRRRSGFGMSSPLLLSPACCICSRRWRTCDHVWGEDIVESYATVV